MKGKALLWAAVLATIHVHISCAGEYRVLYKLQDVCDPVLLQSAAAAEQIDLKVTPNHIWDFLSSNLNYGGDGWFAPTPRVLPRRLHAYLGAVLRVSYSVYSRVVVLELSTRDTARSVLDSLKEWGPVGGCVVVVSQDHSLLSLQSASDASQGSKDPQLRDQWGLFAIDVMNDRSQHVPGAWASTVGESAITVAVVDTGIDFKHPDLQKNAWRNTNDSVGDGLDNDGNGFVDDQLGFNFVDNVADVSDQHGHGTEVAGVIGAEGDNGVGTVGVSMNVRLMALKSFNKEGSGRLSDVVRALDYAAFMGAQIVLLPAVGAAGKEGEVSDINFDPLEQAINALSAEGILVVVPAGNEAVDLQHQPRYPASWTFDNLIVVAASNGTETIATFSSYSPTQVDLVAPGVSIITTVPGGKQERASGTSLAASFVAGVGALLLSDLAKHNSPYQGYGQWVKQIMVNSVDYHEQYVPFVASGGRVNAGKALALQQRTLELPSSGDKHDAGSTADGWAAGLDTQASPMKMTVDRSMHIQKGWGPVMRVDYVPVQQSSSSALRDSEGYRADPNPQSETQQPQPTQAATAATSSRFNWLWDSIRDARTGGLFHGCDDLRDC